MILLHLRNVDIGLILLGSPFLRCENSQGVKELAQGHMVNQGQSWGKKKPRTLSSKVGSHLQFEHWLGEHQADTVKNQVFQQSHWQRDPTFDLNIEGMLPLEGVVAGKTMAPTHCQPRPLLQDWALSNLLTSVLTKINSQEVSPWRQSLGARMLFTPGEWQGNPGALMGSHLFPQLSHLLCLWTSVSPCVKWAG